MNDQILTPIAPAVDAPSRSNWHVPVSLLLLAMPIIASMISRTTMSFVDFLMVSQLGTQAQAAILPAGMLLYCVIGFGMGVLSVVNTFVAQSLGRDRPVACAEYAYQGLWLSLGLGILILPGWFLVPPLFRWVGHEPAVQAMEIAYVQISLLGVGPILGTLALTHFFNGIHRPWVGLWVALAGNGFNVLGNYLLIFGNWGFPAMGIDGAAWATTAASFFQMLMLMVWLLRPSYHRIHQTKTAWRVNLARMRDILWYGLPAGVHFTIDIATFTIFTLLLVGRFGTVQLAAHNLSFKLLEVSFMPTVGLGVALTAAVGKAIGQRRHDLARLTTRWAAIFAIGYMGAIGLGYLTLRYQLAGLLATDSAVIEWAADLLLLCALFQVFDALNITYISALRGAGDSHWPAVVSAILAGSIFMGGGMLMIYLAPNLASLGPWIAATVYIMVLGITMWARFIFGPWKKIELIQQDGI